MTEEFHKYPKIFALGNEENKILIDDKTDDEIIIEEKIDGANFRFAKINGKLVLGSRNRELGGGLEDGKAWKRVTQYIKSLDVTKMQDDCIYYVEAMLRHSICYDFNKHPPAIGFDIYDVKEKFFYNYEAKHKMFSDLNIEVVPIVKIILQSQIKDLSEKDIPMSKYYSGYAEGIMIKNYTKQVFAKIVSDKFKEVNKTIFGKTRKQAENDDELLVATYCTNARIDKHIFNLINDGNELAMPLMHLLPNAVTKDVFEENWREILHSNWTINLRNVKKIISKRCLHVLQQVITNNELNK